MFTHCIELQDPPRICPLNQGLTLLRPYRTRLDDVKCDVTEEDEYVVAPSRLHGLRHMFAERGGKNRNEAQRVRHPRAKPSFHTSVMNDLEQALDPFKNDGLRPQNFSFRSRVGT